MKLALFGGTFDPPHLGHLFIAQKAVKQCGLDKVLFLPNHQSPLKKNAPMATDSQRLDMLRLAAAELPWAEVSDWETSRGGTSYSWETAEHFAKIFPEAELHWLMGVDQWNELERWARPQRLAELLTFIVFPRDDVFPRPKPLFRAVFLETQFKGSSTHIRERMIHKEETLSEILPQNVAEYIGEQQLYKTPLE